MKTSPNRQNRLLKLFEIAESQQGFFTAKQAQQAGFSPTNHPYYVKQGAWIKEERGIYRLRQYPSTPQMELVLYSLWSRDRQDKPQGVFSHETALSIHELSDVMPSKLHMTVPETFRKSAQTPKILVLHYGDLASSGIESRQGYSVTTPYQTIIDLLKDQRISPEFIEQSLLEAVSKGLITIQQLRSDSIPATLRRAVESRLARPRKAMGA